METLFAGDCSDETMDEEKKEDKTPEGRVTRMAVILTQFVGRLKAQRGGERPHTIRPRIAATVSGIQILSRGWIEILNTNFEMYSS